MNALQTTQCLDGFFLATEREIELVAYLWGKYDQIFRLLIFDTSNIPSIEM